MNEKKFNICNLAMDAIILKITALKNKRVERLLREIKINDEDLSESHIALALDDLYEYAVLLEPDDEDNQLLCDVIKAFMMELPHFKKYELLYNWII